MRKICFAALAALPLLSVAQPYCTTPANYYNGLAGLTCNDLKAALYTKISTGYVAQLNSAFWTNFEKTDKRRNDANTKDIVWDIYTDRPTTTGECEFDFVADRDNGTGGTAECQKFNREHAMPQSWFGSADPMVTDLFEVLPVDKFVNEGHANFPYGEVVTSGASVVTYSNGSKKGNSSVAGISGVVFEPIDEYKGDVARIYLYMVTRYHNLVAGWDKLDPSGDIALDGKQFPAFEIPYLKLLLKWHHQDPVSQKEINRNNAVFCIQKNRNPFIDHPEYVDLIWNSTCSGLATLPVNISFFKGQQIENNVKLSWQVSNEIAVKSYLVERSTDGKNFITASVIAAASKSSYEATDNLSGLPAGKVYYRLKSVDKDGSYKYSQVISLTVAAGKMFSLYPNPARNYVQLNFQSAVSNAVLEVTDMAGRRQMLSSINNPGSNWKVNTSSLVPGNYLLKIQAGGKTETALLQVTNQQ